MINEVFIAIFIVLLSPGFRIDSITWSPKPPSVVKSEVGSVISCRCLWMEEGDKCSSAARRENCADMNESTAVVSEKSFIFDRLSNLSARCENARN